MKSVHVASTKKHTGEKSTWNFKSSGSTINVECTEAWRETARERQAERRGREGKREVEKRERETLGEGCRVNPESQTFVPGSAPPPPEIFFSTTYFVCSTFYYFTVLLFQPAVSHG